LLFLINEHLLYSMALIFTSLGDQVSQSVEQKESRQALNDLWEVAEMFSESSEKGRIYVESLALREIVTVSLLNVPYSVTGEKFECFYSNFVEFYQSLSLMQAISARASFLEVSFVSVASFVHNFVMALFYTGLVIVTIGHSKNINYHFHKHWVHTGIAAAALAFSVAGVVYPRFGVGLTGYWVKESIWSGLKSMFASDVENHQTSIVKKIKEYFKKHRTFIYEFNRARHNDSKFATEVEPSLQIIEKKLFGESEKEAGATNIEQIIAIADLVYKDWPRLRTVREEDPQTPTSEEQPAQTAAHQHYQHSRKVCEFRPWYPNNQTCTVYREHDRGEVRTSFVQKFDENVR